MKHLPDATPLLDHAHKYLIYCYVLSSALGLVSCILFSLVCGACQHLWLYTPVSNHEVAMKHLPDTTPLLDHAHKYLIYCYVLSSALGLVSCILFSLVWSHWHSTLDTCYNAPDCGCILYVSATPNVVAGADIRLCAFVSYTQLGVALGAFAMACYYCARSVRDETRRSRAATGRRYVPANRGVHTEDSDVDPCLTPIALTSGLVSVLLLCTAYLSTEGYYKTCSEYRKTAARTLKASGNLVSLIYERLSCDSVLDLMDYTAPSTPRRDPRGAPINTPFLLGGAIIAGWAHLLVWLVLLGYNTLLARRRRGKKGVKEWDVGTNKSVSGSTSVKELNSVKEWNVGTNKSVNGTKSVKELNSGSSQSVSWTNKNVSGTNSVKELNSGTNESVNGTKSVKELNSGSSQSVSWTNKNVSGTNSVKELNGVTEWNVGTNESVNGTNSVKEKSVTRTKSMMGMIHFNGAGKSKVIGTETAI